MIILPLILDILFYNYTNYATCFFLLIFLNKDLTLFQIILVCIIMDLLVIHTNGLFSLVLLIIYILSKKLKGANLGFLPLFSKYIIISLSYLFLTFLIFRISNFYIIGMLFNFIIIIFGAIVHFFLI